jgi:signal transduction histidine kinase
MLGATATAEQWGGGRGTLSGLARGHAKNPRDASKTPRRAWRTRDRTRPRGLATPMLAVGAAGVAITAALSVAPWARFAYRSPSAHVAIDTAATIIALLGAFLLLERFRQTGTRRDLLLVAALAVMAASSLCLSVVPALAGLGSEPAITWAKFAARLLGAGLLTSASFAPAGRLRAPATSARRTLAGCLAAVAGLALLALLLGKWLPLPIDPALSPAAAGHPRVVGNPVILGGQLVGMVLLVCAAAGFARSSAAERDVLTSWLAVGAILAALARLNYFLFPSQYSSFIYTGDVFALAFHLVLLIGAARQIHAYHCELAKLAVLDERRRIARDLHDGLAQDLAFIVSQSRGSTAPGHLDRVASAAERALDDSRAAIAALTRPLDEPLDAALARVADEAAERLGARSSLQLEAGVDVPAPLREALLRIAREAIANAARHGGAKTVTVSLSRAPDLMMSVADDGCGFDTSAPPRRPGGGFGLISMRERAEAAGGTLAVSSAAGHGTTVEVVVPWPAA